MIAVASLVQGLSESIQGWLAEVGAGTPMPRVVGDDVCTGKLDSTGSTHPGAAMAG